MPWISSSTNSVQDLLIKTPNCVNIGHDAISLSYNPETRLTTVLYQGLRRPTSIFSTVIANGALIHHPLSFCMIVYCTHQRYLARYRSMVDLRLFRTEKEIGYAVPGRLSQLDGSHDVPLRYKEMDSKTWMKRLQFYQTELAAIGHVARFSRDCGAFLSDAMPEIRSQLPDPKAVFRAEEMIMEEMQMAQSLTQSLLSQRTALEERVKSQTSLVRSAAMRKSN